MLVLAASFAGHWAVPLAGLAAACTVAAGLGLAATSVRPLRAP
ncbi:hypothetical protein [Streptomyces sp. NPDC099088]